jgi:hypothetical protein
MPKKSNPTGSLRLSEKRIAEVLEHLKEEAANVRRLQAKGKLPYAKPAPITLIRTRDIMFIMNRKERQAQRIMQKLRKKLNKQKDQYISITEFCTETGIPENDVQQALMITVVKDFKMPERKTTG